MITKAQPLKGVWQKWLFNAKLNIWNSISPVSTSRMVMYLSENGALLSALFDPTCLAMPEAGSLKEVNSFLYVGGDNLPFIGKYKLKKYNSRRLCINQ